MDIRVMEGCTWHVLMGSEDVQVELWTATRNKDVGPGL